MAIGRILKSTKKKKSPVSGKEKAQALADKRIAKKKVAAKKTAVKKAVKSAVKSTARGAIDVVKAGGKIGKKIATSTKKSVNARGRIGRKRK